MTATAHLLPDGQRLHLQHGPIDLVIGADGPNRARATAFGAACDRFDSVLAELVPELPFLRAPILPDTRVPDGAIARRMVMAVQPMLPRFVTPMAAVAGAVADTVLRAMMAAAPLTRAYVNNGGDIALHLSPGQSFATAIIGFDGADLGRISLGAGQGIGGIATSARHGRSQSLGIADNVTVLAANAAAADVAATLIANAVDLPGHHAVTRTPASTLDPDSDLGERLVVTNCTALPQSDIARALAAGLAEAKALCEDARIHSAVLSLQGQTVLTQDTHLKTHRSLAHA